MDKRERFLNSFHRQQRARHRDGVVIVRVRELSTLREIQEAGFVLGEPLNFGGYHVVRFNGATESAVEKLSAIYGVENVDLSQIPESNARFIPNDLLARTLLDCYEKIDVIHMWDVFNKYKIKNKVLPVPVAVIDGRFYYGHEDLQGSFMLPGYNGHDDNTDTEDDGNPISNVNHGTACASIVAGMTNNFKGIFGLALNSTVFPITAVEEMYVYELSFARSVQKCIEKGIRVVSQSQSHPEDSEIIRNACQLARDKGILMFFPSGNLGADIARYPARYDTTFGISGLYKDATTLKGSTQIQLGANYGPGVDFCTPFEARTVNSAGATLYQTFRGTSASTPIAASLAANILAINPDYSWQDVKDIMAASCIRESYAPDDPRRDNGLYGHGIPQFSRALQIAINNSGLKYGHKPIAKINYGADNTVEEISFSSGNHKLTHVWSEVPEKYFTRLLSSEGELASDAGDAITGG